MYIENVKLTNFRNYNNLEIEFSKDINVIYGNNAVGKTNILEAIYLSSFGRSFKTRKDDELINFNENYYYVSTKYFKNSRQRQIDVYYDKKKSKKFFKLNGIPQNKLSNIYGSINLVIFKPEDIDIIKNGPDARRKYIDSLIGSLRPLYLEILSNYNKILDERNQFLKDNCEIYFSKEKKIDTIQFAVLNEQISDLGEKIYNYRKEYIERLSEKANIIHNRMLKGTNKKENLILKYKSNCTNKEQIVQKLFDSQRTDFSRGFTSIGIQRDEIDIKLNGNLVSDFGSQGQKKSSMLSIKLAELELVKEEIGENPVLLLDDFMSELDDNRRVNFIKNIEEYQIIITSTNEMIIENRENKIFKIESANIEFEKIIDDKKDYIN